MAELHRPGIAILASGSGSTAEAFIHATQDGRAHAEVGLVIIETAEISGKTHPKGKVDCGQTLAEAATLPYALEDKFLKEQIAY